MYHWKAIAHYYIETSDDKDQVTDTNIPSHLELMLDILTQEESERESGDTGPCMEYLLHHKILETVYTLGKADCPPGMKQQVLSFYTKLLGRIRQPLLPHINVHRPVLIIQPTIRGDQWTKGWTMDRTEKTHGSHKKLPLIDGGSGR
uniref:FHF complex subunit HOOK interacting protein 2A-like isoform X2 n=1 Tax=Oncorhynchus gorbuscha TaxID=8017 RepID=UPI001EAEE346|nr:FHF complex subunit HOOK interacting protein 2A-like isoform X2 [Oncorhynchus gorbuscha]